MASSTQPVKHAPAITAKELDYIKHATGRQHGYGKSEELGEGLGTRTESLWAGVLVGAHAVVSSDQTKGKGGQCKT